MRITLALLACLLVACGSEPPSTEEPRGGDTEETSTDEAPGSSGRVVDGYYTAAGAPAPLACASDDECVASGVLAENGCCWSFRDMNAVVMSTAYRDWTNAQRTACDTTRCPSPPVPTQPPDCLFQVRCAEGRCVNECP